MKSDCGEWQKMSDTYKVCQTFLPLSRLFCSAIFVTAKCPHRTPQKIGVKLGGAHMRITAEELQIRTDYILFHRVSPRSFSMLSMTFLKTS